jgi:hypothetical protein
MHCRLDTRKFTSVFNFTFTGTQPETVQELVDSAQHLCVGREVVYRHGGFLGHNGAAVDHFVHQHHKLPSCPVCGSADTMFVLDLGFQALANNFVKNQSVSINAERFPLLLLRCRSCHHSFLAYVVSFGYHGAVPMHT